MSTRARARVFSLLASSLLLVSIAPISGVEATGHTLGRHRSRWSFNRMEECLMHKINHTRARYGYSRLRRDKQIGLVARRHAKSMAANYSVYHDSNMEEEITRWRRLGQNSGASTACKRMFRDFMGSSGHRANILGRWRFIGVGAEWRNHHLFVQQVFEWRRDPGNIYSSP